MEKDETIIYNANEFNDSIILEVIKEIKNALDEKGYNGINQIVGYLVDGDLAYISNYKNSRNKIKKIEREKIVEALIKNSIGE